VAEISLLNGVNTLTKKKLSHFRQIEQMWQQQNELLSQRKKG